MSEADSIGQLQNALLELAESMVNGLGLVTRNAIPVNFDEPGKEPLSLEGEHQLGAWRAGRDAQPGARREFAEQVVAAAKKIDRLAESLPPLNPPDEAELEQLQDGLDEAERQLEARVQRATGILKRVRKEKEQAMRLLLEKRPRAE